MEVIRMIAYRERRLFGARCGIKGQRKRMVLEQYEQVGRLAPTKSLFGHVVGKVW